MDIRPAAATDLAGIAAARLSNGPAHHDSGANPDYCTFLIQHGHLWVAVDDEQVLGFGGAVDTGGARLLSDLYVHRDAQGRGVGSTLLDSVLRGAPATFTFASSEPAAQAIYARAGMVATWSLSTLRGVVTRLPGSTARAKPIDLGAAVTFERARAGLDHAAVLRYWAARPGNHLLGIGDIAGTFGMAVVHRANGSARVEHLVADDGRVLDVFATAVRAAASRGDVVEAYVPEVRSLHGQLRGVGFEVTDTSTFMTSRPGVVSDALQVLHPGLC